MKKVVNVLDASDLRMIERMKRETKVIGHRSRQSFDIAACSVWFSQRLARWGFPLFVSVLDDVVWWNNLFELCFKEEFQ